MTTSTPTAVDITLAAWRAAQAATDAATAARRAAEQDYADALATGAPTGPASDAHGKAERVERAARQDETRARHIHARAAAGMTGDHRGHALT